MSWSPCGFSLFNLDSIQIKSRWVSRRKRVSCTITFNVMKYLAVFTATRWKENRHWICNVSCDNRVFVSTVERHVNTSSKFRSHGVVHSNFSTRKCWKSQWPVPLSFSSSQKRISWEVFPLRSLYGDLVHGASSCEVNSGFTSGTSYKRWTAVNISRLLRRSYLPGEIRLQILVTPWRFLLSDASTECPLAVLFGICRLLDKRSPHKRTHVATEWVAVLSSNRHGFRMKRHAFVKKNKVPSPKLERGYVFGVNSWVSQNKSM